MDTRGALRTIRQWYKSIRFVGKYMYLIVSGHASFCPLGKLVGVDEKDEPFFLLYHPAGTLKSNKF